MKLSQRAIFLIKFTAESAYQEGFATGMGSEVKYRCFKKRVSKTIRAINKELKNK